jgi:hypothetical protein
MTSPFLTSKLESSYAGVSKNKKPAEPFLRIRQLCTYWRIFQHFMEPESPLPCSQETFTGSHSFNQFSPVHITPSYLSKINFNIKYKGKLIELVYVIILRV